MLRITLGVLCAVFVFAAVRVSAAVESRDMWVEVRVNGISQPDFAMLHVDLQGHLYVRKEDVRAWHMTLPPSAASATRAGPGSSAEGFVRIDGLPGLRVQLESDE